MKFLMVGLHYAPEPTGNGPYSRDLADGLVRRGHSVTVIGAQATYPYSRRNPGVSPFEWSTSEEDGIKVIRCPVYLPSRMTGLKRILHYLSFAASSALPVIWCIFRKRPDVVLNVVPTLISAPLPVLAARLIRAKTQVHVQDFEVEAGMATGQMSSNGRLGQLAVTLSDMIFRAHDLATSISPAMVAKLRQKGCHAHRCYELRNWADTDTIRPSPTSSYRQRWNITSRHIALYSGSIVRKQGIEVIVEVAKLLSHRRDITFVICGDGSAKPELLVSAQGLGNIQIHGLQPREMLGDLLNLATIHLLPQKADVADLVLPSKLTNMLASGKPSVVGASPGTGLALEIEGCGFNVPPDDAQQMASAIETLLDDEAGYVRMCAAARKRAETAWAKEPIISRYLEWLSTNINQKNSRSPV